MEEKLTNIVKSLGVDPEIERKIYLEVDYILKNKRTELEELSSESQDLELIATELFKDKVSWGRICTFLAFVAILDNPETASEVLIKNTGTWIQKNKPKWAFIALDLMFKLFESL